MIVSVGAYNQSFVIEAMPRKCRGCVIQPHVVSPWKSHRAMDTATGGPQIGDHVRQATRLGEPLCLTGNRALCDLVVDRSWFGTNIPIQYVP